ncbi:Protein ABCI12, chloroplastic [Capsicum baccatum]|uniref:Protein ABCI12, chloroplastic n=1 Tax=Capsicum baccatum TaxID=33114 RepID=A0A2G2XRL4_CAPBA|nr:Protein ABCI12, chloroplastic [Capsicum baccatum]
MYANFPLHNYPTLTPTLSSIHGFKHQSSPNLRTTKTLYLHLQPTKKSRTIISCAANSSDSVKGAVNWPELLEKWSPKKFVGADKLFRAISGATSSPIAQYIPSPFTFVHSVDPRIKLAWLFTLVILPAKSNAIMRLSLVAYLAILSILVQPAQVWKDQLGRVTLLSGILFIMLGLSTDSAPSLVSSRAPPPSLMGLPPFPTSLEGYKYVILKLGPLQLTRKGLSAATTSACLTFTIFQSASVYLSTTTPEQIAFALRWFISPLANLGVPVAEVILTLLLSLRFINLVFDEVRNVALGIVSRRINWPQMTFLETIDVFFTYIRRIFRNIFVHAEQISQAMIVRGFRGDSTTHKIFLSADSSSGVANYISLSCLFGLIALVTLPKYLIQ